MERYRVVKDVGLYHVTFTIVERLPVFIDETACKIITDGLNLCAKTKSLVGSARVLMPAHHHAIVFARSGSEGKSRRTEVIIQELPGEQGGAPRYPSSLDT